MKEFLKKNIAMVLAFALPIVFIAIVVLITYLPSLSVSTDYNFIYTICTDGDNDYSSHCNEYLQKRYSVVNNKLVMNPVDLAQDSDNNKVPDFGGYMGRIFLHDTKKNESREITFEEAKTMMLSSLLTSADGVTVSGHYDSGGDFFIFGGGTSSQGYYLTKGSSRSKLNIISDADRYSYRNNFQFIGWVLPGRK